MLNAPVMEANDAVSGSMAECYVTIDGNRYNMMQLYSFESSAKVNSQDVKILGRTGIGKKPTGWSGSWKGTAHFNQSVFRRWFLTYCKTGSLRFRCPTRTRPRLPAVRPSRTPAA